MKQVSATVVPTSINNIVIVLGVVTVLEHFFFTFKQSPVLNGASEVGKWVIMITFERAFGNAVMGRISLIINQIQFLFGDWIHLVKF